jgi:phage-related baseplate assembly protein
MRFDAIDLSQLPPPALVENLSYEAIRAAQIADLRAINPAYTAILESDPGIALLEVSSYRELLLRQRVNDSSRAVMLALATGSDLDQIAARYAVARLAGEDDARLRARVQLAPEAFNTAGSRGAYEFHALSAHEAIRDAGVSQPRPGAVLVALLSVRPDGVCSAAELEAVVRRLNAEDIKPLTDTVLVRQAELAAYDVVAELTLKRGPDAGIVEAAARLALAGQADSLFRVGTDVPRSALIAALHRPGVQRVRLLSPAADLVIGPAQAGWLRSVKITVTGRDD